MPQVLVPTVCPYCAAGCGFYISVEKERATGIEYMPEHPANEGPSAPREMHALEIFTIKIGCVILLKRKGDGLDQDT